MTTQQPTTTSSPSDSITLRYVVEPKHLSRSDALRLWKEGKLTGLFNLPSQDLFDACVDFCIQAPDGRSLLPTAEFEGLQKKETALRETNKLLLKSLAETKETAAKSTRDSLLKEEELTAKLKSLETKRLEWESERKDMKRRLKDLKTQLNSNRSSNTNSTKATTALTTTTTSQQQQLTNQQQKKSAPKTKEAEQEQEEEPLVEELIQQNKYLQTKMMKLQRENDDLRRENERLSKQVPNPNQTDHLNKILLESFINNMNFSASFTAENDLTSSSGSVGGGNNLTNSNSNTPFILRSMAGKMSYGIAEEQRGDDRGEQEEVEEEESDPGWA